MYANGIDVQNLDGFGDFEGLCCDDCAQGLSGVGLVADTPTSPAPVSIWQTVLTDIDKILGRTAPGSGATYPIYTPPYTPSYPVNAGTPASSAPGMFSQPTNWLPWALAAGALVLASRR